ncbi:leucine-rich repeat protein [Ruminococcus sp. Marseille-P6503]|uniref:leucine-rich repeat protein n=1 Tax=Ruminococcus sp. Marseille-P6503 TaxID=2364796 RepID=UPI000F522634|nr:leucine-rich repeat protein [Ruminococcus sp. Marseille-P6503]
MLKKVLAGVVAVVVSITTMATVSLTSVLAAEITDQGSCGDSATWTIDAEGLCIISGSGDVSSTGSIRNNHASDLKELVVENDIVGITAGLAFNKCVNLAKITLKESVASVSKTAFKACTGIQEVYIYSENFTAESTAFDVTSNPTFYIIEGSATETNLKNSGYTNIEYISKEEPTPEIIDQGSCGDSATWTIDAEGLCIISGSGNVSSTGSIRNNHASDLKELVVENDIVGITAGLAFNKCVNLTKITLEESVASVSKTAFKACTGIQEVYIYSENFTAESTAFDVTSNPTFYVIEGSATETNLKNSGYTNIAYISDTPIPSLNYAELNQAIADGEAIDTSNYTEDSVKILTDAIAAGKAVKENTSATQTDVNNAVQAIKDALNGLVEEITVVSTYDISVNGDGSVTATLSSNGTFVISGTGATKDYNLGTTTNKAPWQYDDNAAKITSVEVKDGVTSLGNSLFAQLGNLESVSLPDTLTSIGTYCFGTDYNGKNKLTSVVIPESVTSIGNGAFRYSTSLVSVTLPSGLTSIPEYILSGCTSLTTVNIPETVTSIGSYAFYNCSLLTSVTLLDSITSIGESAFQGCSSLTSINIPSSLTTLGAKAFRGCNLTGKVIIPEGITVLDSNIFRANPSTDLEIYVMGAITTVGTAPFSEGAGKIYVYDAKTYNLITGTNYGAFEIIYDGEVDTSDLEAVIAQAEALNESDYTASTWAAVASALEAARTELANEDKTSTSVMAATTALTNAINGLIEEGKYMSYIYKNGSMATLVSCKVTDDMTGATKIKVNFDCAFDVSYNPNATIDFLINNDWDNNYEFKGTYGYEDGTTGCSETLELSSALVKGKDLTLTGYTYSWGGASDYVYAVTSVEFLDDDGNVLFIVTSDTVILDTEALEAAIAKGEAVDSSLYTADSYAVLTSAISAAKTVLANAEATQDDVDAAAKTITDAIAGLKRIVITGNVTGTIKVSDKNSETEITVVAVSSDGSKTTVTTTSMGSYTIENLEAGEYTLTISGGKYASRSYLITVAEGENTHNVELNPYGDLNGDGEITTADVGMANSHAKGVIILTDYVFACANVSGDKIVSTADVGMMNSHAKLVNPLW